MAESTRHPWRWIPTLYFGQGIPYVVVMTLSVIVYKNLGLSNADIALYTSWLYLPWVIKPLWSPVVDMFKTKRLWILSLQLVIGAALAAVAGLLFLLYYGVIDFFIGFIAGVKAFTAAVLGGIGSLPGAVLGGLAIGLIETFWSAYFSVQYKDVAAFSVLIIVLIFMPTGLLGRADVEKV